MKPYKEIEHTADTALEIQGATLEQLLMNAVKGFYYLASVPELKQSGGCKEIVLKETSLEELIISFLNELNYYLTVHFCVFTGFENFKLVKEKKTWKLYAKGILTVLEPETILNLQEIKAVTYHQIQVERKNGVYSIKIVFDI
ncbi:MAG TPA: archease [Calditrichaeota bacterium]|nr:archease [Calditrichota bacterium]